MCRSKKIICRPGYSTIMDLSALQKPAYFIPTPGQTEQEYLAKLHGKENGWSAQNKLKISNKSVFKTLPEIKTNLKNLKC
jgi:UDP-N-acetylglucosamine:LPS N-acetylglucosamine transferase